ncbi:MAG: histidine phosphatase family protein [Hyphomicrobiales bacterium]
MRLLYFIRHGETDWNAEGRLQGQRDIPLNAHGREQAARNGRALAGHFAEAGLDPAGFDFVASPLSRAAMTMRIVRGEMGLDPEAFRFDPRLMEITFGDWEGVTLGELATVDKAAADARAADKWNYVPPRGESYSMLSERIGRWLDTVDRPMVAVSHGGVNRVLRGLLAGNIPTREVPILDVPQDRILVVRGDDFEWL